MSPLRPVKSTYTPKYPRRLTDAELREYLRPGLARRFSNETLVLSTLLIGSTLASCARSDPAKPKAEDEPGFDAREAIVPNGTRPLPMKGKSTRTDPKLKEKVDQAVVEVLDAQRIGHWLDSSRIWHYRLIADNPLIKAPSVQISYGNSIMGIFNAEEAKRVTKKLFETYGIPLEPDVKISGDGYVFEADGFNVELGVGFEIRTGDQEQWMWDDRHAERRSGDSFLGHTELSALEKDITRDKIDMFVCNPYINYDGDNKMAMTYYLSSLIDYLNWIHGDKIIEYEQVLGEKRERVAPWSRNWAAARVLWDSRSADRDPLAPWTVDAGTATQEIRDDGAITVLHLEPGSTAVYHRPDEIPGLITDRYDEITLVLILESGASSELPIDFDLYLNDDPKTRSRRTILEVFQGVYEFRMDHEIGKPNAILDTLSITNVNRFPVTLHLKRIAVG